MNGPDEDPRDGSLIHRLKERALFQWAAAYLAAAWLSLDVVGFLADTFLWPAAIVRRTTIALGVGLALVVVLAWQAIEAEERAAGERP